MLHSVRFLTVVRATRSYAFRKKQLQKLKRVIREQEKDILQAFQDDLHKPVFEGYGGEVGVVYEEINQALRHLHNWMQPEPVATSLIHFPSRSTIYKEPLDLVLIVGPWNDPFQLLFAPLVGAIAGGNCVVLKPAEEVPHTAIVIEKLIGSAFEAHYITVVQGVGASVGTELIEKHRFDHIFFTGSVAVGRQVMAMAARQLTPVTLELGGKSLHRGMKR